MKDASFNPAVNLKPGFSSWVSGVLSKGRRYLELMLQSCLIPLTDHESRIHLAEPSISLGLQTGQSRSCLYTLGANIGIVYVLAAPGCTLRST